MIYCITAKVRCKILIKTVYVKQEEIIIKKNIAEISSIFYEETCLTTEKFLKTDYPLGFNSVINEFQNGNYNGDESFITPSELFGITNICKSIEIPYC